MARRAWTPERGSSGASPQGLGATGTLEGAQNLASRSQLAREHGSQETPPKWGAWILELGGYDSDNEFDYRYHDTKNDSHYHHRAHLDTFSATKYPYPSLRSAINTVRLIFMLSS